MATLKTNGRARENGKAHRGNGKTNAAAANGGRAKKRLQYNCAKCPGYCCTYPVITVTDRDVARLARHFGISEKEAERRFTKSAYGYKRIMRRKHDEHFGKTCRFFDTDERRCTIYEARPYICRAFPGGRCGYYDFLMFERRAQEDPEFVALTDHR
jgi:Fe-S-cluster containining protein